MMLKGQIEKDLRKKSKELKMSIEETLIFLINDFYKHYKKKKS